MQLAISSETTDADGAIPGGYYYVTHVYMPIAGVPSNKCYAHLIVPVSLS